MEEVAGALLLVLLPGRRRRCRRRCCLPQRQRRSGADAPRLLKELRLWLFSLLPLPELSSPR